MTYKMRLFIMAVMAVLGVSVCASYAQQQDTAGSQINDFSLAGYGEKGKKTWDLAGKTADIMDENVKLTQVVGNLYGKEENITLTAKDGDFNKVNSTVHLENNVTIVTTSGTTLKTDSLDWDRKNQVVSTPDKVNIARENMVTVANGAMGQTNLKKVELQKDVRLDITPMEKDKSQGDKIIITCDGPLEIDYDKNIATFKNNVKVERPDSIIFGDSLTVYFIAGEKKDDSKTSTESSASAKTPGAGSKIEKIITKGNVKIIRGQDISYSDEAIYTAADRKITLNGRPRLIISQTEGQP